MEIRPYQDRDESAWDALVEMAPGANFLHSRKFLAYHKDRFSDASRLVEDDGRLVAIFPAATDPDDPAHVISHPGATYGGLVAPRLPAAETLAALTAIARQYRDEGTSKLTYKTVPSAIAANTSQADRYALWRLGATVTRCDLWSVVSTRGSSNVSSRLKRQLGIAEKNGLEAFETAADNDYRRYHDMLSANLNDRHGVKPVHSPDEMIELRDRLGAKVSLWLAAGDEGPENPLAGVWLFRFGEFAWHTQYIAASSEGRERRAMHFLLQHLLEEARASDVSVLSHGAVTEQNGKALNSGLEEFKIEFGGDLIAHEFFSLSLNDPPAP